MPGCIHFLPCMMAYKMPRDLEPHTFFIVVPSGQELPRRSAEAWATVTGFGSFCIPFGC